MQGRCKPNGESLFYAEVQPVLAMCCKHSAKLRWFSSGTMIFSVFRSELLRQIAQNATDRPRVWTICRMMIKT